MIYKYVQEGVLDVMQLTVLHVYYALEEKISCYAAVNALNSNTHIIRDLDKREYLMIIFLFSHRNHMMSPLI